MRKAHPLLRCIGFLQFLFGKCHVQLSVLRVGHYEKIVGAVVLRISVDVMHHFMNIRVAASEQLAPDEPLRDASGFSGIRSASVRNAA